jgi:hypothetical protein
MTIGQLIVKLNAGETVELEDEQGYHKITKSQTPGTANVDGKAETFRTIESWFGQKSGIDGEWRF